MKIFNKINSIFAATILLSAFGLVAASQQTRQLIIERVGPFETAAPGQLISLRITGSELAALSLDQATMLPLTDFKVEISQNRASFLAPVKEAHLAGFFDKDSGQSRPGLHVAFILPKGLQEGEATLLLSHTKLGSAATKLSIASRPSQPRIETRVVTLDRQLPPSPNKTPQHKFEKGRLEILSLSPLVDPNDKDAAILVTFKQGKEVYETQAQIKYLPATQSAGTEYTLSPSARYEAYVKIPPELQQGDATMEIHVRINGLFSDPTSVPVTITDLTKPEDAPQISTPRILALSKNRVGLGQTFELLVEKSTQLEPNPGQVIVVIEQGSERYHLKPVFNSALTAGVKRQNSPQPVMLRVRTRTDLIGQVKVRVLNPAKGEELGMSEGVSLEILGQIVPPTNVVVREATDGDVEPLRRMRDAALKAGREFPDYNPAFRYVTIQAENLEMDPQNLPIKLGWGDKTYQLRFEDYSLSTPMWIVFRLPEDVPQGQLQVTVANRSAEGLSEAVTKTVEIKMPPKQ